MLELLLIKGKTELEYGLELDKTKMLNLGISNFKSSFL
ncbi:hypothetical protein ES708_26056 [subsurface metagenome]